MENFPIGGGAINGGGALASFVYLPASSIDIALTINERNYVTLSGSMSMGVSLIGDLTKVAPFGNSLVTSGFVFEGSLASFQSKNIGDVTLSMTFDVTGNLAIGKLIPDGSIEASTEFTGDLTRIGLLSGDLQSTQEYSGVMTTVGTMTADPIEYGMSFEGTLTNIQFLTGEVTIESIYSGILSVGVINQLPASELLISSDLTGSLTRYGMLTGNMPVSLGLTGKLDRGVVNILPLAPMSITIEHTGLLSATTYMSGNLSSGLAIEGTLTSIKLLQGNLQTSLNLDGSLSNNADVVDSDDLLMIRPYTLREMVR